MNSIYRASTPEQAFGELLGRIGANKGEAVLVNEEELAAWPDGAVRALKGAGLLSLASPASSMVRPGWLVTLWTWKAF